jgi:hypothetical protein
VRKKVFGHDSTSFDTLGTDFQYRERLEALVWYSHCSKHFQFRGSRLGLSPVIPSVDSLGWHRGHCARTPSLTYTRVLRNRVSPSTRPRAPIPTHLLIRRVTRTRPTRMDTRAQGKGRYTSLGTRTTHQTGHPPSARNREGLLQLASILLGDHRGDIGFGRAST